ncbi:MAG: hypothetical protein HGA77_02035 [Chlorobiaceae bacterium]|nr:hypothetical protein [Chlorobiaceae bacterium]
MNELEKHVFISEIVMQSKIAERAAKCLVTCEDHFDPIEIWSAIQSILVAAANVSKILWPQRKTSAARGKILRTLLSVDDRNLLSDRNLRNHFEHYDERIETWFEKNCSAVYMDPRIDPFESIWGRNHANLHRVYNPKTQTLTFRGELVDLAAILKSLEEIRRKCRHLALP